MPINIKSINEKLTKTGKLDHRVIGIYTTESKPTNAVTTASIIKKGNPCLAKALFKMASQKDVSAIYIGEDVAKESCFGAMAWFGYTNFPPKVENMFTSDSPSSNSMFIKKNTDICTSTLSDMGKFTSTGKYVVMQALEDMNNNPKDIKSILCFGTAEQIRNLGGLIHFSEARAFTPIMAPWGSGCATFVAFPAGVASGCPKDTAILSPFVPESNQWFPANMLALGIPIQMAQCMAEGYESSFAVHKADITYPVLKETI